MTPKVSIIVPCYGVEQYLDECMDTLVNQTLREIEIILVDDGSTDNTKEIVEMYEGIHYIYQEHAGISKARNTAVKVARGKWIATLDSDDLWQERKLQKQVNYLRTHPDCRIIYTAVRNFTDVPEHSLNERQRELFHTFISWYLPSALIDAKLFDEIGMFDESLACGEDTDWNLRLRFYKINMEHCIDEVLYFRRIHNSNISETQKNMRNLDFWRMATDAFRKTYKNTKNRK